jgi:RNA polymerase sigma-70 factor (ECF subfamily)
VVTEGDDDLLARVARGDGPAFARLVDRHRDRLMALAARVTGSRAAAEDIVQETFTRAWINAPLWRHQGTGRPSYAAWLSRVAFNLAIDLKRRAPMAPLEAAAEPLDPAPAADAVMMRRERAVALEAAIKALPPRQRAALSLCYDADLSNAEGAAAMGVSVGAFELLLVRARRALRLALADDAP